MTTIPSQAEYEQRELDAYARQIRNVECAPLIERRAGRDDFRAMLEHIDTMAERLDWLLDGSYGYGAMLHARGTAANKRMNRAAHLSLMITALECNCPSAFARGAYLVLEPDHQAALNAAILIEADRERDS